MRSVRLPSLDGGDDGDLSLWADADSSSSGDVTMAPGVLATADDIEVIGYNVQTSTLTADTDGAGAPMDGIGNVSVLAEANAVLAEAGAFISDGNLVKFPAHLVQDALAMPVHWYYDRQALFRDYGRVTDYLAPKNPHSDSILWRSSYTAPNKKGEILHDQARYWGKRGVHYHQFLQAGENTLNLQLCSLLIESLNENGLYNPADYLQRYIRFMTFPGMHRDTYIEECHRYFFSRYALGFPPEQCGALEKHIGGLVGIIISAPGMGDFPAFTMFDTRGLVDQKWPVGAGPLWPLLFGTRLSRSWTGSGFPGGVHRIARFTTYIPIIWITRLQV